MRGKVRQRLQSKHDAEDHPRLCGEKANKTIKTANAEGSPPPMRGKGIELITELDNLRITPAYAGKSSFASCSFASFRDHPRLCGEKSGILRANAATIGSPPPMRGKA